MPQPGRLKILEEALFTSKIRENGNTVIMVRLFSRFIDANWCDAAVHKKLYPFMRGFGVRWL